MQHRKTITTVLGSIGVLACVIAASWARCGGMAIIFLTSLVRRRKLAMPRMKATISINEIFVTVQPRILLRHRIAWQRYLLRLLL